MIRVLNQDILFGPFFFSSVWKHVEMFGKAEFLSSFCPVNPGLHGRENEKTCLSAEKIHANRLHGRKNGVSERRAVTEIRKTARAKIERFKIVMGLS
jgi:hypothetical protein